MSTKNALYKREWKKTPKGFLSNLYSKMLQRVKGNANHTSRPDLYRNKPICTREEFVAWAITDKEFNKLFNNYLEAGRLLSLAPSIDRIDSEGGYVLENMQFLMQGENSQKAGWSRNKIVTPPKAG